MSAVLPRFPYHPDPIATGFVKEADKACLSCGRSRGFIYTGPVFAEEELSEAICPWCIADGSAAERFDAIFTDDADVPDGVPDDVVKAVATRTPGFSGWQQEHWLYHCDDGAAFLGVVGRVELDAFPSALDELRRESAGIGWSRDQIEEYLSALDKEGSPTAYLFECRHCGRHLAYSDSD